MTTTNTRPTCESCPYWIAEPEWKGSDNPRGECRRWAPKYHTDTIDRRDWAATLPTDWCGDHPQMVAYISGLAGGGDALREAVLAGRGLVSVLLSEEVINDVG